LKPALLASRLAEIVGPGGVVSSLEERRTYESDGLPSYAATPGIVVLPDSAGQVQRIVALCHAERVPFVARGSGTGLSGGALPLPEGVLISLTRLRRILEVDLANQRVVVEPGVTNLAITQAVAGAGFYYAPDPSSQQVCSVGGNVAENSGGAHCLKYGFTTHHVVGLELVLPDASVVHLGGKALDAPGYDLLGAFIGSEGTLGIATRITLKILRRPEAVRTLLASFASTDAAGEAVSEIIAAGIVPAAIEMMDALAIEAAEAAVAPGYPKHAGAILIVELDGPTAEVEHEFQAASEIARRAGARELRVAQDDDERALIWKGRKSAFAAVGRISPDYYVQDGVIPRTALPVVLRRIASLAADAGLRVANVFHAGDGNLHPLVLYDAAVPGQAERAEAVATQILDTCLEHGGSVTGEHGIGVDKRAALGRMFSDTDLRAMQLLRCAFDPESLCNPGKVFPTPRLCGDRPGPRREHPAEATVAATVF
jgi:glycolate oxidase